MLGLQTYELIFFKPYDLKVWMLAFGGGNQSTCHMPALGIEHGDKRETYFCIIQAPPHIHSQTMSQHNWKMF